MLKNDRVTEAWKYVSCLLFCLDIYITWVIQVKWCILILQIPLISRGTACYFSTLGKVTRMCAGVGGKVLPVTEWAHWALITDAATTEAWASVAAEGRSSLHAGPTSLHSTGSSGAAILAPLQKWNLELLLPSSVLVTLLLIPDEV